MDRYVRTKKTNGPVCDPLILQQCGEYHLHRIKDVKDSSGDMESPEAHRGFLMKPEIG